MTSENIGIFNLWLNLPRDDDFTWKGYQYLIAGNIIWFLMFFVLGRYHPLPKSLTSKCNDYDKFVLRYRIICIYHGAIAWATGIYWYAFEMDLTCSKKISNFELFMLANTAGHFI